jgi:hypothetical protein
MLPGVTFTISASRRLTPSPLGSHVRARNPQRAQSKGFLPSGHVLLTRLFMVPTAQPQICAASSYEKPEAPTRMRASRCSAPSKSSALRNSTSRCFICSGSETSDSAYDPSVSSTSRRRFRYSERKRLRKIVNNQAGTLVRARLPAHRRHAEGHPDRPARPQHRGS